MNLLQTLLVSEIHDRLWVDVKEDSESYLRNKYPALKDAWEEKQKADSRYEMLLKLIRATGIK